MPYYDGVKLSAESMQAAREWFAANARACIAKARAGSLHVNDLDAAVAWYERNAAAALAGERDNAPAFLQRAHFIQTGRSPPMMPKR